VRENDEIEFRCQKVGIEVCSAWLTFIGSLWCSKGKRVK
jgi:hypothetical protein